ncbi:MAG: SiaC family regulatory phosphoprotein [Fusobacteriaceae bacterium]|nr:SiaC family regulatory phosphoprotein [Fusobacteriaceae bacterium]
MENLFIEGTQDSFDIKCNKDTGKIILKGNSYPENVVYFFDEIFKWIERYIKEIKDENYFRALY